MIFAEPHSKSLSADLGYLELSFNQFKIIGKSIAGVETVIAIPQWDVVFDTGRAPDFAFHLDHLALSHWHLDHAGGLSFYLGLRRLNSLKPLKIIVPREKYDAAAEYLEALKKVSDTTIHYEIFSADQPLKLRNDLTLKGIPTFHGIQATGYLVEQTRSHLKHEFQGKSEAEIQAAHRAGQEVSEKVTEPFLAYSGDTCVEFLGTDAAKAKYLLMECSFFDDEEMDYAMVRKYGHTHVTDWAKYADRIESEVVIMIHTSQRYSKKHIEAACRKHLPKTLQDKLIVFR